MTYRIGRRDYSGRRRTFLLLAAFAAIGAGGCSSTTLEDTAPAYVGGRPVNTGTYPNLNIQPQAAAAQLSAEEKAAKLAALYAAQQRQSPGAAGETPEARRKRLQLLADDQADTLKVIEADD